MRQESVKSTLKGKRVLLLGDSRMAFPISKTLSKQGVDVFAGVSVYSNYLEWSRFVRGTFRHPSTDLGTDAALPYIYEWLDQNPKMDAIQPVSESASRLISRHRDRFAARAPLIMPSKDVVALCSHKGRMFQMCDQLGIPLAPYRLAHSKHELFELAIEIGYPVIVKPSCVDAELFGRKALIIKSTADLNIWFETWPEIHPQLIVQKYVHGPRHSVVFSAHQGKLIKAVEVAALRTHESDGTGYTTLGVSVAPTEKVKLATETLVRELGYTSTGCTQFVVDPVSGEVTFLEFNPRTSLARIAEAAGVRHSTCGLLSALNQPIPDLGDPWETKVGTRYVWTKGDLMRIKRTIQAGHASIWTSVGDLANVLADATHASHAIFDPLDPGPAFGTYAHFLLKYVRRQEPVDLIATPAT